MPNGLGVMKTVELCHSRMWHTFFVLLRVPGPSFWNVVALFEYTEMLRILHVTFRRVRVAGFDGGNLLAVSILVNDHAIEGVIVGLSLLVVVAMRLSVK